MRDDDFTGYIKNEKSLSETQISAIVDVLTLRPRTDYLKPPAQFKKEDIWPWRFNRRHSLLYRPLIVRKNGDSYELVWGLRCVFTSLGYYSSQLASCRFKGVFHNEKPSALLINMKGSAFETFAYQRIESVRPDWKLYHAVKRIPVNGKRISVPWGDMDIMAFDNSSNTIYVIECKDLSRALDVYKLKWEFEEMFGGKNSIIEKQKQRAQWTNSNLTAILKWASFDPKEKWKVSPVVVTSNELVAGYMHDDSIPIMCLPRFCQDIKRE